MHAPERRQSDRVPLRTEVAFRRRRSPRFAADVRNLTRHGCKLMLAERVSRDETVWVGLPGLAPLQARISWVEEWDAGVEFDQPMHPAVFDHLMTKLA